MTSNNPYYADEQVTLLLGDALEVLRSLPDASVDCVVTSPPYFGQRDYGNTGQYGLESTPAEYVATMTAVFREARRVLADDGSLWLNLGDSYYSGKGEPTQPDEKNTARRLGKRVLDGPSWGLPRKNLLGIPWRTAIALQDDGWILRNDIIWAKPNAMPESVRDRVSNRHEHLFLLTKQAHYWFDLDSIRQPFSESAQRHIARGEINGAARKSDARRKDAVGNGINAPGRSYADAVNLRGTNPGDVWTIPTRPYPQAHFATFPRELPIRCISAGCRPGGTVLDPFSGSGTTGAAARHLGRKYVGIDLNPAYHDLAIPRFAQGVLDFGAAS